MYKLTIQYWNSTSKVIRNISFAEGLELIRNLSLQNDVKGVPFLTKDSVGWWQ